MYLAVAELPARCSTEIDIGEGQARYSTALLVEDLRSVGLVLSQDGRAGFGVGVSRIGEAMPSGVDPAVTAGVPRDRLQWRVPAE
jgi:hypothetical protein